MTYEVSQYRPLTTASMYPLLSSVMELLGEDIKTHKNKLISKGNFPKINIKRVDDHYILEAAIAGYNKDDVQVIIENRNLIFKYDKEDSPESEDKYLWKEMTTSSFERRIAIPEIIDIDKIESSYADGIITIKAPIAEFSKPRRLSF